MTEADVDAVAALDYPAPLDAVHLRDELQRGWSRAWVAREQGGGIAAFLLAWHVADELHVLNIATGSAHRRNGFGRALLAEALRYAGAEHVRLSILEVRRTNHAAIALYRAAGFVATNIRARYYPDDEDAIDMALLLDLESGEVVPREDEVELDS